jgi:hypothetical protein
VSWSQWPGQAALLFTGYSVSVGAFTFVGEFLLMLWLLIKWPNHLRHRIEDDLP